ncbi:hypothetical protein L9F63_016350 [Diploptera punctata]|uniref:Solute carrier organic anion transporter family member n=1 Tax=Diploptera punctata TaxID=6984 RepID=A0AAD8A253_DIPPU|nr:hypothetical protein L9F63_016350 [Diploptera punctata]
MEANNHNHQGNNSVVANNVSDKEKMIPPKDFEDLYKEHPLTDETMCGIGPIRSAWLQKFANKKAYVFLYGLLGCTFSASHAYFNGTITTLEKRFKIPSRTTGIITVGNDISQLFVSMVLSYYTGRGHRPRWIALGIYTVVLYCLMSALPHLLYGPGDDALALTVEYGGIVDHNSTQEVIKKRKLLCGPKGEEGGCEKGDGSMWPPTILFLANFVAGIGGTLYYTLGVSYMDDNIQKAKTPALISFSYFLRMLGPAIGYSLASLCLKFYISPTLTPTIGTDDPRWLGAWWFGWIILSIVLAVLAAFLALFPKTLPRAAVRRMISMERQKSEAKSEPELPASMSDMVRTFWRLITNPTLMCNNLAAVFYFLGYMPYWVFMAKYIETQYRQSASTSSLITGTVGLVFSAFGILISGLIISKYKPRARYLAAWNVIVGIISVLGIISYAFLGCPASDHGAKMSHGDVGTGMSCYGNCSCDYVKYSPVCSEDGTTTFISPCHAGCMQQQTLNGSKIYADCRCVVATTPNVLTRETPLGGITTPGSCPIDCRSKFFIFLAVVCLLKFSGSSGRASNFLLSVRCVEEKDKPIAMGFGMTMGSLCAFIPSPILFGIILDKTCLVWGKTCSGTGNCWLYDGESLRYVLNFTAASFVAIGTVFDAAVWYYSKNLKIFDEEVELKDVEHPTKEKIVIDD